MYVRTFVCPDDLKSSKDVYFNSHDDYGDYLGSLKQGETPCLCCGDVGHLALLKLAAPAVTTPSRTTEEPQQSLSHWVGRDYEGMVRAMARGEAPPKPITGIMTAERAVGLLRDGIDPGTLTAVAERPGESHTSKGRGSPKPVVH